MSYVFYNPNPLKKMTSGDCTIRAISKAMGWSWDKTYVALCLQGMKMCEMPSANIVWGNFLLDNGFEEHSLMRRCKECYTIGDFCNDHPVGTFVVGTDSHAVCCYMGNHYDSFDSGSMNPTYYFEKLEPKEEKSNG